MVLFKMLNKGMFSEINGCVSTGKEANVYHASTPDGEDLAIKVYKVGVDGMRQDRRETMTRWGLEVLRWSAMAFTGGIDCGPQCVFSSSEARHDGCLKQRN
jgi:RIO-like serine/threonine protein kinase